ncbi:NADH-quinone oxidoreductase subunit J family protein [Microbacter margulisiae]|uniref:NADH-quinone oxidoreductase subunit J n=1 Tax=Microbacter margulisiae TaxID=1350067 RepID=A0A7W5DPU7_9PORP|nr:NADH-quinone oxidoreductase subunit J [Microbacter margulisiae]MBB3186869.1 NADH-quinone oxidoreductase subunit J [Microbacter margulisiae]
MNASTVIFYVLAILVLTFGAMTVFTRKIFRAAIYLLFSLISVAGIYLLWGMDFVAALQIIIYVGGIVVLIIFSILLTQRAGDKLPPPIKSRLLGAGILSVAGLGFTSWIVYNYLFTSSNLPAIEPSVHNIGKQMLNYTQFGYVFPFEVINILLLAALVGSIVIAMKKKEEKSTNDTNQTK